MSEKLSMKQISYRPSKEALDFLEMHTEPGSTLNKSGLIEVAVRLLMAWPEAELAQIIGNAVKPEKLKTWVESYVNAKEFADEP